MSMIHFRKYDSYDSYKKHQKRKLKRKFKKISAKSESRIKGFVDEFKKIQAVYKIHKSAVLCLAARLGEEVTAWSQLGHDKSIGIDLNPGRKSNKLVIEGDFHDLPFKNGSFNTIYCNSLDHALDFHKFSNECNRVLCEGGILLLGLNVDFCGISPKEYVKKASKYESVAWSSDKEVIAEMTHFSNVRQVHMSLIKKSRPERNVFILEKKHE